VSGGQGWPPPSAATASAARSVLDGREHGGTLSRIGYDLPDSASRILYSLRERELGSAWHTSLRGHQML